MMERGNTTQMETVAQLDQKLCMVGECLFIRRCWGGGGGGGAWGREGLGGMWFIISKLHPLKCELKLQIPFNSLDRL